MDVLDGSRRANMTVDDLRALLDYDQSTGVFSWRATLSNRATAGMVAGWRNDQGYILIGVNGRTYRAHRLAVFYVTGQWPDGQVDHRDRRRANNAWANLRVASQSDNNANGSLRGDNTSGVRGVRFCSERKKWVAYLMKGRRHKLMRRFDTMTEAIAARHAAEAAHFKEFAPCTQ